MKKFVVTFLLGGLMAANAMAQFTGPSTIGRPSTVAEIQNASWGSYVTVTGHIVEHQRQDYYTFRDATGDIRVEIEVATWQGRPVDPETKVRLLAEVDRGVTGRYLWVKSLEVIPVNPQGGAN